MIKFIINGKYILLVIYVFIYNIGSDGIVLCFDCGGDNRHLYI